VKKAVPSRGESTAHWNVSRREEVPLSMSVFDLLSGGGESLPINHAGISGRRKTALKTLPNRYRYRCNAARIFCSAPGLRFD
jgi:hypothetical protein